MENEALNQLKTVSGTTRLYAVIGSPVKHSMSPLMYNTSFMYHNIDSVYTAFEVDEEHVKDAISAVRLFDMGGINITMPGKTVAVPLMDKITDAARLIGAVNTVVNENGKLIGHNTDGVGFVDNLRDNGVDITGKKITIAGGGGAATAVIVQCALDGAHSITILNRKGKSFDRQADTMERLKNELPELIIQQIDISDTKAVRDALALSDIFANATQVGMNPKPDESIIKDASMFQKNLMVTDLVYNPVETKLLREAKEAGCKTIDGRGMLLWQGAAAFKLYTGKEMPIEEVKRRMFENSD